MGCGTCTNGWMQVERSRPGLRLVSRLGDPGPVSQVAHPPAVAVTDTPVRHHGTGDLLLALSAEI